MNMWGFKENVIMGNLIPAGTGMPQYRHMLIKTCEEAQSEQQTCEEVASEA